MTLATTKKFDFFATCPKNLEELLEQELLQLGATATKKTVAGVYFSGDLTLAYRSCLWSRFANRVLLPLTKVDVRSAEVLYAGVKKINWLAHFNPENNFLVDFAGQSDVITHTQFGAQKVKDAIVDQMREKTGNRPSVQKEYPDIRINVYLQHDIATISLDLSGESLHERGYRQKMGVAPLKENLAAALLTRAGWPALAKQGKPFIDPLCGSGTLLIEAAMIAADIAPGLLRWSFGFQKWLQHQPEIWQPLWDEAEQRRELGLKNCPPIYGFDNDEAMITIAKENSKEAELLDYISITNTELAELKNPTKVLGLIVTNPPYGERLGNSQNLIPFYQMMGEKFKHEFAGWDVALIVANLELSKEMRLRAHKEYAFFNGAIACRLLVFKINN